MNVICGLMLLGRPYDILFWGTENEMQVIIFTIKSCLSLNHLDLMVIVAIK